MAMTAAVLTEQQGLIGTIILNQPFRRNALGQTLHGEMITALKDFQKGGCGPW
jgi:enoyl-CoA hydratase/carnithine racemase